MNPSFPAGVPIRPSLLTALAVFGAALLSPSPARADLLLYEPFDYAAGPIVDQGGSEIGFTPGSVWTRTSTKTTEVIADSIGFGTLATTGNKFHFTDASSQSNRNVSRPINLTVSSGDLYITYLMQGPNGGRLNGGVYINGTDLQEFGALRSEYNTADTNGVIPPHVFYGGTSVAAATSPATATTYMYVQKYTGLGSASGGTARLWLIDAANYDALAADGQVTEAELDANFQIATPLLTLPGTAPTLDGTENLRLHCHDNGSGTADYVLDEIRVATTLGEAMDIPPNTGAAGDLKITDFTLTRTPDPENVLASITFTSSDRKTYSLFYSSDLLDFSAEISDSIQGETGTTTFVVDFNDARIPLDSPSLYFIVRENG